MKKCCNETVASLPLSLCHLCVRRFIGSLLSNCSLTTPAGTPFARGGK